MLETIIETASWVIGILLFTILVPKSKRRQAITSILVMQAITWPLGFIVAEFELIRYPVRFFDTATTASFTFEYFIFPIVSALFNLYYPKGRSFLKAFSFTSIIVSALTISEVLLEIYTDNIEYLNWDWYWSWLSMFVVLHLAKRLSHRLI